MTYMPSDTGLGPVPTLPDTNGQIRPPQTTTTAGADA